MGTNSSNEPVAAETVIYDLNYAKKQLFRLFNALADATNDEPTAIMVIEKIADGIEADPETAREFLTPENIGKVFALKAKADAGTLKFTHVTDAFPVIEQKFGPLVGMMKTFIK